MCGICGAIDLKGDPIPDLERRLDVMSSLIAHRGPDDSGLWIHDHGHVGLAHRRLSIIDLEHGHQPMGDERGPLDHVQRRDLQLPRAAPGDRRATVPHDVATPRSLLRAYDRWGTEGLNRLRGMFAYAIWDEPPGELVSASAIASGSSRSTTPRSDDVLYFASEAKALLPFLPAIETDLDALKDYSGFQFCLGGKTLFKGIQRAAARPLCYGSRRWRESKPARYWEVYYDLDFHHTDTLLRGADLSELLHGTRSTCTCAAMCLSAAYLSGGLDSSVVASLAATIGRRRADAGVHRASSPRTARYDESRYARAVGRGRGFEPRTRSTSASTTSSRTLGDVIYHLDYPVAGPGSFPQFMVSQAAATRRAR